VPVVRLFMGDTPPKHHPQNEVCEHPPFDFKVTQLL